MVICHFRSLWVEYDEISIFKTMIPTGILCFVSWQLVWCYVIVENRHNSLFSTVALELYVLRTNSVCSQVQPISVGRFFKRIRNFLLTNFLKFLKPGSCSIISQPSCYVFWYILDIIFIDFGHISLFGLRITDEG